jgi:EamA-like transporter family protein
MSADLRAAAQHATGDQDQHQRAEQEPQARHRAQEQPFHRRKITPGMTRHLLLMVGLGRTPASAASLMLNLEGVLTAFLAWVVFREHVHRRIALGMAAIVAGGVLLSLSAVHHGRWTTAPSGARP